MKSAIVYIHGIGLQTDTSYADNMMRNLQIKDALHYPLLWANTLPTQWHSVSKYGLGRGLISSVLADAIYYQSNRYREKIDAYLLGEMQRIDHYASEYGIIVIAHSLGGIIAHNFFNSLVGRKYGKLVTHAFYLGTPFYIYRYLYENRKHGYYEHNIFSPFDLLADVAENEIESSKMKDISIRVGGWKTFWNPLCHFSYWDSTRVAAYIRARLET